MAGDARMKHEFILFVGLTVVISAKEYIHSLHLKRIEQKMDVILHWVDDSPLLDE